VIALRPLSIGEIVDRAVTVGIRNIRALSIVVVFPVFLANAVYVFAVLRVGVLARSWALLTHGALPARVAGPSSFERFGALLLLCVISSFAAAAVAAGVARANAGEAIDARDSARAAMARWPAILGLGIVAFVVHLPESVAARLHAALAEWSLLPFETWFALVVALALCAVAIERRGSGDALAAAFRWMGGSGFRRSSGIALAVLALAVVASLGEASLAAAAFSWHAGWLILPVFSVVDTVAMVGTLLIVAVYYFDCRVVRDGFGLL
jgi:hypothetical protein